MQSGRLRSRAALTLFDSGHVLVALEHLGVVVLRPEVVHAQRIELGEAALHALERVVVERRLPLQVVVHVGHHVLHRRLAADRHHLDEARPLAGGGALHELQTEGLTVQYLFSLSRVFNDR